MQNKPTRLSGASLLGDHEQRVRGGERERSGRWIYVGLYPSDDNTTSDSPPFENGWTNADGTQPVRFRWDRDGRTEIQGGFAGGTDESVVFTLPAEYAPAETQPLIGALSGGTGFYLYEVQPDGSVYYYTAFSI